MNSKGYTQGMLSIMKDGKWRTLSELRSEISIMFDLDEITSTKTCSNFFTVFRNKGVLSRRGTSQFYSFRMRKEFVDMLEDEFDKKFRIKERGVSKKTKVKAPVRSKKEIPFLPENLCHLRNYSTEYLRGRSSEVVGVIITASHILSSEVKGRLSVPVSVASPVRNDELTIELEERVRLKRKRVNFVGNGQSVDKFVEWWDKQKTLKYMSIRVREVSFRNTDTGETSLWKVGSVGKGTGERLILSSIDGKPYDKIDYKTKIRICGDLSEDNWCKRKEKKVVTSRYECDLINAH